MNKCVDCRHWGKEAKQEEGVRRCEKVPMLFNAFEWDEDGDGRVLLPKYKGVTAFVQDGSDYLAFLYTNADFGCSMWEPVA